MHGMFMELHRLDFNPCGSIVHEHPTRVCLDNLFSLWLHYLNCSRAFLRVDSFLFFSFFFYFILFYFLDLTWLCLFSHPLVAQTPLHLTLHLLPTLPPEIFVWCWDCLRGMFVGFSQNWCGRFF